MTDTDPVECHGTVKVGEQKAKRFLATGICDGKKLGEQN